MARGLLGFLVLVIAVSVCGAASVFQPISDSHRSLALEIFTPVDGKFVSLEEAYEALRTFEILGIERKSEIKSTTCDSVSKTLGSSSSTLKDLFYALKASGILKCELKEEVFEGIVSRLQTAVKDSKTLLDFYHSVGSLTLIKGQTSKTDLQLENAEGIFRSIKALSQSDGRWRYSSDNTESSALAAGVAFETLAGVISLAPSEIDQSLIETLKKGILKLFDSIEKYDDGAFYFDEKLSAVGKNYGPLSTTASVVKGLTAFGAAATGSLNIPGVKIMGLAKFFLGIGTPSDVKDFFKQVDSLACLEDNRFAVPVIVSLPSTVISLTKKDLLKVKVTTVLGASAPAASVKLVRAFGSGSKDGSIVESQELKFDTESGVFVLDPLPVEVDVGSYMFVFETVLHDSEHDKVYTTGGHTKVPVFVTGLIKIENAEITVLDSDLGSIESQKKLNLAGDDVLSLSANHLQKLRLSLSLTTPLGKAFKPHQAFLKLKHESKVEHVFLVGSSGEKFEIVLDFLRLVEKFFYLSGKYDIQLTLGDSGMENSVSRAIGYVELDLPEPSDKAPRPPPQPVDPYTRFVPKAEISHIFRSPEKRPPREVSLAFLALNVLPFIGFLVGLFCLGANLKNFPTSAVPATFGILFHGGIAAVLLLYVLFWVKLDLFTTLKALGFLGVFLLFVGHQILSHLASTSTKLKST